VNELDEIPGKLGRYFRKHNFIILYPEQIPLSALERMISDNDLEALPLEEGIERMTRFGKSLRRILYKQEKET